MWNHYQAEDLTGDDLTFQRGLGVDWFNGVMFNEIIFIDFIRDMVQVVGETCIVHYHVTDVANDVINAHR